MIRFYITIVLAAVAITAGAQTVNSYRTDLEHLYSILKKTPSFREQVKGSALEYYDSLYNHLRDDTADIGTDYDIFYRLARLFFPLRDNHLGFYQLPRIILDRSAFNDSTAVVKYRTSKAFLEYPASRVNLDSLESALKDKEKDSLEGLYYYENYLKVGLFRSSRQNEYLGVILSTGMPTWEKGQIAIHLYEHLPGQFRAIYGHPVFKGLVLYNNEKFRNRSLVNSYFYASVAESVYQKDPGSRDFVNLRSGELRFQYKHIVPGIQYIRLGSFSARTNDMKESQEFYDHIRDSLTAPHLIVDLRNNSGGAAKVSGKFLQLIENFSRNGKVYVLINNGTMSQGEIFTLQLKKLPNVKTFGQTTMGTIAYGSNYGRTEKLPSGAFQVYVTDMNVGNYLRYENVGVAPDIILANEADWIDQVVSQIKRI